MSEGADTAQSPSKRKRRTPSELRRDILAAAQAVFSEKGYAAASIREIAARADAAGPLIFRHFQDKATLFAAAVFEPLEKTLDENLSKSDPYWVNLSPVERVRNYAELVIETIRRNKRLFIAYMNASVFHADEFSQLSDALSPASFESRIVQLERFSLENPAGASFTLRDPHFEVRLILLLLCSVALFDDLFFKPSERDLEREMRGIVKLVSMGVGLEPGSVLAATGPAADAAGRPAEPPSARTAVSDGEMSTLVSLQGQINSLFEAALQTSGLATGVAIAASPEIELIETGGGLRLVAQLQGMGKDDVELSLKAGMLTLRGRRRSRPGDESCNCPAFERCIPVGAVDEKRLRASFEKGVLMLDLPRPPGARSTSTRIPIDARG